jgi:(S)-citramalyl-CoA lyase
MSSGHELCRSLLFVPANRPDRTPKALATVASLICIDLEDAVAGGPAKDEARRLALEQIAGMQSPESQLARVVLRINSLKTPEGLRDILAVREFGGILPPLVIPKVDSPEELSILDPLLARPGEPKVRFLPMIESARGLEAAAAIASALPRERLLGLFLGGVDLSTDLGCALEWEPLLYARSRVVHAARSAGLGAIDAPALDTLDPASLEDESRRVARLGFMGKAVIHPRQLEAVHRAFAAQDEELERAQAVVEAYERTGGGVSLLDGKLIERPVYEAAKRLLSQ